MMAPFLAWPEHAYYCSMAGVLSLVGRCIRECDRKKRGLVSLRTLCESYDSGT